MDQTKPTPPIREVWDALTHPGFLIDPQAARAYEHFMRRLKAVLEAVSGVIEKGESRLEAARRELGEELGIVADELIDLGKIFIDTSIIKAPVWLFLARDLTFTEPHPVESEIIKRVRMKIDEAVTAVIEGRIVHAPSCILILKIIQNSRLQ